MEESYSPQLEEANVESPVTYLKEQGENLKRLTNGVLTYEIKASRHTFDDYENTIVRKFYVVAPLLDNLSYFLFSVKFNTFSTFPIDFGMHDEGIEFPYSTNNWNQFQDRLKMILSSKQTKKILENLLAHSKAASES